MRSTIFKMIGSQSSRLKTANEAIDYIFSPSKTDKELCDGRCLLASHPHESWQAHPFNQTPHARLFIHAILSPIRKIENDVTEFDEEAFVGLAEDLRNCIDSYPTLTAIHTKHKGRPHIHLLIHPTNMKTGKKWQQSKNDLKILKETIDKLLVKRGFAPILFYTTKEQIDVKHHLEENTEWVPNDSWDMDIVDITVEETNTVIGRINPPFQGLFTIENLASEEVGENHVNIFGLKELNFNKHSAQVEIVDYVKNGVLTLKRVLK